MNEFDGQLCARVTLAVAIQEMKSAEVFSIKADTAQGEWGGVKNENEQLAFHMVSVASEGNR